MELAEKVVREAGLEHIRAIVGRRGK